MPLKKDIPVLVKHCALAIFKSEHFGEEHQLQRVQQALTIARSRLLQYGFLRKGSDTGGPENIHLTAKGHRAESKHMREKDGLLKTKEWDKLYALVSGEVEEGEGETTQEDDPVGQAPREVRKEQRQRRLAHAAKAASKPRTRRMKRIKRA